MSTQNNMMHRFIKLLWIICICFFLINILYFEYLFDFNQTNFYRHFSSTKFGRNEVLLNNDSFLANMQGTKYILDWTTFGGSPMTTKNGWLNGCPQYNCQMIDDKSMLSQSDAVVFHYPDLSWHSMPFYRSPNQYYVFYLMESPENSWVDPRKADGFFNLTISYRRDSDFFAPYGAFRKGDFQALYDFERVEEFALNKTELVAWFVSNCETASKRELYVRELKKFLPVHVYGGCNRTKSLFSDFKDFIFNRPFSRTNCGYNCNDMLKTKYKFYLAFENSICLDYVTEKLFERIQYYVVPIVLNATYYKRTLPPHSVISASDFSSVKQLADYLLYLDKNNTAYLEYFQWRRYYHPVLWGRYHQCDTAPNECGFCALCAFLQNITKPVKRIKYNAHYWWHHDAHCDTTFVPRLLQNTS